MENKRFLTAQDVMEMLGVSLSYSYKQNLRLMDS
jgi:predicted DNA-binding transcriptional regulator AlpA